MKRFTIVISVLVACLVLTPLPAHAQVCNRVAGASQTANWYGTRNGFESYVVNAEWERMARGGQTAPAWGIGGTGWRTRIFSPCTPATSVTRFILQVSPDRDEVLEDVVADLVAAVDATHTLLPSATRITFVPPIGGDCPGVYLASVQSMVVDAISQVVGADVDAGPALSVPDCTMFRDGAGHLTGPGATWAAQQMAALL
jgi:hypothetical protein